jgi:hypothetical protein
LFDAECPISGLAANPDASTTLLRRAGIKLIGGLRKRYSRQLSQRDFHDVFGAGYLLAEQNAIVHADSRSSGKVG